MYANGRGVARDDGIAAKLFALAAAQGHAQSQRMLLYVRPKTSTLLPACLVVAEWSPSLKLSRELAAAESIDEAARQGAQQSPTAYSAMQVAR